MKPIRTSLIVLAAAVCSFGVQAQTTPTTELAQSAQRDFAPDRWSHFTAAFQAWAGVRGESNADELLLVACVERDRRIALSFHPAGRSDLSENADATLTFDGGAPVEATMRAVETVGKGIIFLLLDRDPKFWPLMEKFMSSKAVEIVITQSGTEKSRHRFTLNGAPEAITPAAQLCGH